MQGYRHILWATDLGERGEVIGERAAEVARRHDARLSVLHVVAYLPPFEFGGELALPTYPDIEAQMVKQARQRLTTLAQRSAIDASMQHVVVGSPRFEVVRFAREHQVDLIVVGRHVRHGLGLLLGSTANGVLNSATCDVLAVTA